jgi:hypothetical protein
MNSSKHSWELILGSDIVGKIVNVGFEFPWTLGMLIDSPDFERFRVYFSDEDDWPETEEFDAMVDEIRSRGGFQLRNLSSGEQHRSFRLNQQGNDVWFRF